MSDYKRDLQVTEEKVITTVKVLISGAEKRGRQSVLSELEQDLEARIGEYQKISTEAGAMGNDFEAVAHGHYAIEALSLLSLIRSKKGGA